MPYGKRHSNDDTGHRNAYGTAPCLCCGKSITRNGLGRKSHIAACVRRSEGTIDAWVSRHNRKLVGLSLPEQCRWIHKALRGESILFLHLLCKRFRCGAGDLEFKILKRCTAHNADAILAELDDMYDRE